MILKTVVMADENSTLPPQELSILFCNNYYNCVLLYYCIFSNKHSFNEHKRLIQNTLKNLSNSSVYYI